MRLTDIPRIKDTDFQGNEGTSLQEQCRWELKIHYMIRTTQVLMIIGLHIKSLLCHIEIVSIIWYFCTMYWNLLWSTSMLPVPCSWNLRSERALSIFPVLAVHGGWTLLWTVHLSLFVICPLQIGLLLCLSLSAQAKNGSQQLSVPATYITNLY